MNTSTLVRALSTAGLVAAGGLLAACNDAAPDVPASDVVETPQIVDLGDPIEDDAEAATTPLRGDSGLLARPVGELPSHYRFVERSGKEMTFGDIQGKFAIVDFIFTSCAGPCPPMAVQMRDLQEKVRDMDDVVLISVSVDPRTDTTDVLADYAESVEADDDTWLFARMPIGFVNELTRSEFLLGDGGTPFAHSTKFVLVDRQGRGRGIYDPLRDSGWIEKVLKDIVTLRSEVPPAADTATEGQ